MDTVAEGVETDDQLHYAREAGFTNVQGYFFRRPMTDDQVAKLLAEHHSGDPLQLPAHQPEAPRLGPGAAGTAQQRDASQASSPCRSVSARYRPSIPRLHSAPQAGEA